MASFLVQGNWQQFIESWHGLPLNVTAFTKPTKIENGRVEIGIIALPGLAFCMARISPAELLETRQMPISIYRRY
jgi:hypothetical protein